MTVYWQSAGRIHGLGMWHVWNGENVTRSKSKSRVICGARAANWVKRWNELPPAGMVCGNCKAAIERREAQA